MATIPADLAPETIRAASGDCRLLRHLVVCSTVGSTMDLAARLAMGGAPEGTTVIADHQTAGRGRLGRSWHAPAGGGILMSVLFRPPAEPRMLVQLPMAIGIAAVSALRAHLPSEVEVKLKWPNDVLLNGAKLGGLLSEATWVGSSLVALVVGLGLNVGAGQSELPPGATSLAALGLMVPQRAELVAGLLVQASSLYERLLGGESLIPLWRKQLATIGQLVKARTPTGIVSGEALDVGEDGALVVRSPDGTIQALYASEVTLAPSDCPPAAKGATYNGPRPTGV